MTEVPCIRIVPKYLSVRERIMRAVAAKNLEARGIVNVAHESISIHEISLSDFSWKYYPWKFRLSLRPEQPTINQLKARIKAALEKIQETSRKVYVISDHQGSLKIQSIRAAVDQEYDKLHKEYHQAIRALRQRLNQADFDRIAEQVSDHMRSVGRLFSSLYGKIRGISKAISRANGSIDKRIFYRKKLKVIFRMSDDEDSIQ